MATYAILNSIYDLKSSRYNTYSSYRESFKQMKILMKDKYPDDPEYGPETPIPWLLCLHQDFTKNVVPNI